MTATAAPKEMPPPMAMLQLISGFWVSRCTYVAAKLGIPDLLKDGPKTADRISGRHRQLRAFTVSTAAGAGCSRHRDAQR